MLIEVEIKKREVGLKTESRFEDQLLLFSNDNEGGLGGRGRGGFNRSRFDRRGSGRRGRIGKRSRDGNRQIVDVGDYGTERVGGD